MYQMSKANNSKNWIKGHVKDPFVIQAQKDGYRSRAAYKLIEIDKKYKIIKSGITAVDLGAAPWRVVSSFIKKNRLKGEGRRYRFVRSTSHQRHRFYSR